MQNQIDSSSASKRSTKVVGSAAEQAVVNYLQKYGATILAQNYRKSYGEIDIIAQYKDTIAFVEVKSRRKQQVDMTALITPSKQKTICKVARVFIAENQLMNYICRFDVALVSLELELKIEYMPNAFMEME